MKKRLLRVVGGGTPLLRLGLILLLAIPLVLLTRDFARDVILSELMHFFWAIGIVVDSLPQLPLWILFILLALSISLRSLFGRVRFVPSETFTQRFGPVHALAHQIRQAASLSRQAGEGSYFRWRLARRLGSAVVDVLAHQQHAAPDQIWRRLRRGTLDIPQEVEAYLQTGLAPVHTLSAEPWSRLRRFLALLVGGGTPPLQVADPELERVVRFLEDQVEGSDGYRHR